MFNKLKFNNIVISNKKIIQQGRNQIINKLVKKLKKLQYLLEKNEENIKNKNRIRKNVAYLEQLKKLKRFQIIKSVLLLEKNPTAIITNDRASPEEIVIAMLATNKLIIDLVNKIRGELHLTSLDNSWKEKLMENSKRQNKMEKVEYRRAKRKDVKDQKNVERKRNEWLEENRPNKPNDNDSNKLNMTSSSGIWLEEELDDVDHDDKELEGSFTGISSNKLKSEETNPSLLLPSKNENNTEQLKKDKKMKSVERNQNETYSRGKLSAKDKINKNANIDNTQKNNIDKNTQNSMNNGYGKENRKVVELPMKNAPVKNKDSNVKQENVSTSEVAFVEDPFFITETGETYLSTAIVTNKKQNVDENEGNSNPNVDKKIKTHERNNYENENQNYYKPNSEFNSKRKNKDNSANNSENLHPSWAAKQKQKPTITNFQGKKITFNDDDNVEETVPQNNFNKNTSGAGKIKTPNKVENNLHPSWAAKQKQKQTITAFEGKKIKFDDDDS